MTCVGFPFVVGLNLVIQTVGNVDVWCNNTDEERAVDVCVILQSIQPIHFEKLGRRMRCPVGHPWYP